MREFFFSAVGKSVQLLSHVQLFETPWIAACQASLSITNSRSSLKLTSIESVMPSSHLILGHPLLLLPPIPPSIKSFPMSQLFAWGGLSIGVSASASVLLMNTQDRSLYNVWQRAAAAAAAKSLQLCLTLSDPMDSSPPGSSVHRILQARILEWVASPFSLTKSKCLQREMSRN